MIDTTNFNSKKMTPEEKEDLERIAKMAFESRPKRSESKVLDHDVTFITIDYKNPENILQYGDAIKEFETDMNFVTIASAESKDVLVEDYQFTETMHIFIDYPITRLIAFNLPPMSLKEMIWNISRIYTEIHKSFRKEAKVCCGGYEFLYLKKLRVHNDNVISISIELNEASQKS